MVLPGSRIQACRPSQITNLLGIVSKCGSAGRHLPGLGIPVNCGWWKYRRLLLEGTDPQISIRTVSFLEKSQIRYKLTHAWLRAKENEQRSSIVYRYKKGKTLDLYTKESEGKLNAECHTGNLKPSNSAEARPPPQHGAGEPDGSCKSSNPKEGDLTRWLPWRSGTYNPHRPRLSHAEEVA